MGVGSAGGIDLENKSIGMALTKFAVPSILAVWVFALYTMVDGMFVGRGVGPEALAAVNLSLPFINIMFAISILITIGAGTLVGKLKGEGKIGQASEIFSQAIYFLAGFGALVCFLAFIFVEDVAYLMGARGELIPMVAEYLGTLLFFQTFYLMAYSMEVFAKIDGFPQRELAAILCAAVTNIILDYVFIIQYVKIGTPDSITEMSAGFVLMAFNNAILFHYGTAELSAFSVIGYINNFMLITYIGLTQGMQPIITFSRGKKDHGSILAVALLTVKVALLIGGMSALAVFFFGDNIAMGFLEDPELVAMSHQYMKIFSLGFIFMGVNTVISGFFTALEAPKRAGLISLMRGFIMVMLFLSLLPMFFGAESIWWVTGAAELVTVFAAIILFARKISFHRIGAPVVSPAS